MTEETKAIEAKDVQNDPIRKGKWILEEERYAEGLIFAFKSGLLTPTENDGRSLRSLLAHRLNCSAMRISKKFVGLEGLGGRFYRRPGVTGDAIEEFKQELLELEARCTAAKAAQKARYEKRNRNLNKNRQLESKGSDNAEDKKGSDSCSSYELPGSNEYQGSDDSNEVKHCDSSSDIMDFDDFIKFGEIAEFDMINDIDSNAFESSTEAPEVLLPMRNGSDISDVAKDNV
mmetsp:Transcript_26128/g.26353  ORF Transcript_26128/g.26353 Transcript_26128/m.26353 type:complete len:231 (-) Transcript_26128:439-1131(-)